MFYVNKDTSNRFYYRKYDSIHNPDTLSIELLKKDKDGFCAVGGSAFPKYLFGDKKIKILDSGILYKLPDSNRVFTYLDCSAVKKSGEFQARIFHSYFERSHSSTMLGYPQSIRYNDLIQDTLDICGKKELVYEFEAFNETATYALLIGFLPGKGIVYIGYSIPFPLPDQRWEKVCRN